MKKVIFILALAVSAGSLMAQSENPTKGKAQGQNKGKAQGQKKALTVEEKATKASNKLKTTLSLTDEQTTKVNQITTTRITSMQAAKETAKTDKAAFGAERKKIIGTWEADLKGILTADQFTQYNKLKEERKAAMKEKRAKNNTSGKPTESVEEEDGDDLDE